MKQGLDDKFVENEWTFSCRSGILAGHPQDAVLCMLTNLQYLLEGFAEFPAGMKDKMEN